MKTTYKNLFIMTLSGLLLFSCDKAKERPETIDKEIQGKLISIQSFKDLTTANENSYFVETETHKEIEKLDKTVQIKINDDVKKALSTLVTEKSKKAIAAALKAGPIGFVVLPTEIKIYQVVTKSNSADERTGRSALTLEDLKTLKKEKFEAVKMTLQLDKMEKIIPSEFIEVASLKISKTGVIENKKTKYYEEKMSVLTLAERPLELSTHVILENESVENQKAQN